MTTDRGAAARVLIVSFSYWPMLNARAFRWTALAEDWVRRGLSVHVVCALAEGRPREECVRGVHVHRTGAESIERLRAWLARERTQQSLASGPTIGTQPRTPRPGLSRFVQALNRRIWRKLHWPDTTCLWYFNALRTARAVAFRVRPDVLISVSPTFTAVAVGRALLNTHRPRPHWIIDLGDPFSYAVEAPPNNFRLYGRLNVRFERACFTEASAISVTNALAQEGYAERFPESASRITVIPPLLSLSFGEGMPAAQADRRRLVFVGTLYPIIRSPDYLLSLFRALAARPGSEDVELHFYGDSRECADEFLAHRELLGSRIFVHGPVTREGAANAMRTASVLVNIGNRTAYQLPSKIVEYAMTGKPILNIASVADDSSSRFLESYPLALTLHTERAPTESDVARLADFLRTDGCLGEDALREWVEPYTLPRVSSAYLALTAPTDPVRESIW